jgi:hypothetical protein
MYPDAIFECDIMYSDCLFQADTVCMEDWENPDWELCTELYDQCYYEYEGCLAAFGEGEEEPDDDGAELELEEHCDEMLDDCF